MLKNRRLRYALGFLAMSMLAGSAALAALSVYMPPEQVAEQSPLIVEGTVNHVATGFNRSTGAIATYITIDIDTVHRGPAMLRSVTLREPGGAFGDLVNTIDAVPVYTPGEKVWAFLQPATDGALRTTGMFFGKYTVEASESGRGETARRDLDGRGLIVGRPANFSTMEQIHPADLEALAAGRPAEARLRGTGFRRTRQRAVQGTSGSPNLSWRVTPPEMDQLEWNPGEAPGSLQEQTGTGESPAVSRFTTLSSSTPARWYEIDSGASLVIDVERINDPLGDGAAAVYEMERAMAAWTDVPESRVALELGDGNADFTGSHASSPAAAYAAGTNIMLFDDPYNDITDPTGCGGVLAIGGYWSTSATGAAINGVTYRRALTIYVIFNNNFECFLGIADNLAEVATHELGHSIGLGHSTVPDAIMAATAGGNSRGPRLGDDDMDAVHCIYPHTLKLTSPLGGETWTAGESRSITWDSSSEAGSGNNTVELEFSTDGGSNWQELMSSTINDGLYNWSVVNSPGNQFQVQVVRHNRVSPTPSPWPNACSADGSTSNFSVLASPLGSTGNSLTVTRLGGQVTLTWNASSSTVTDNYAVYEGDLNALRTGTWEHSPSTCTAGTDLAETIVPTSGDRYFLIAPLAGSTEGNLGLISGGALRPESASACGTRE